MWPWESCLLKSVYTSVPAVAALARELRSWGCEQEILANVTLDEDEKWHLFFPKKYYDDFHFYHPAVVIY